MIYSVRLFDMAVKPPKTERVTARISSKTKRQLQKLHYSTAEVIAIGAEYLSNEANKLEFEKGELELEIANLKKAVAEKEQHLTAINNRLRIVAPNKIDDETLHKMLVSSASSYAKELIDTYDTPEKTLERLESVPIAKSSVRSTGENWGFNPDAFLTEVKNQLENECQTVVSDKNSEVL